MTIRVLQISKDSPKVTIDEEKQKVLSIVPGRTMREVKRYEKIDDKNWYLFKTINNWYSIAYFVGKYASIEEYRNQKKLKLDLNKIILVNNRKHKNQSNIIGMDNILNYLKGKSSYAYVEKFLMELTVNGFIAFHDKKQARKFENELKATIEKRWKDK